MIEIVPQQVAVRFEASGAYKIGVAIHRHVAGQARDHVFDGNAVDGTDLGTALEARASRHKDAIAENTDAHRQERRLGGAILEDGWRQFGFGVIAADLGQQQSDIMVEVDVGHGQRGTALQAREGRVENPARGVAIPAGMHLGQGATQQRDFRVKLGRRERTRQIGGNGGCGCDRRRLCAHYATGATGSGHGNQGDGNRAGKFCGERQEQHAHSEVGTMRIFPANATFSSRHRQSRAIYGV